MPACNFIFLTFKHASHFASFIARSANTHPQPCRNTNLRKKQNIFYLQSRLFGVYPLVYEIKWQAINYLASIYCHPCEAPKGGGTTTEPGMDGWQIYTKIPVHRFLICINFAAYVFYFACYFVVSRIDCQTDRRALLICISLCLWISMNKWRSPTNETGFGIRHESTYITITKLR